MTATPPIAEIIRTRFSCRSYLPQPIAPEKQRLLRDFMRSLAAGPFTTPVRFDLIADEQQDGKALRGLGTYGFIQGASGFVVGAVRPGAQNLEDYGYLLEKIVLYATELGLGTCWLGGTFSKSSFARKIAATNEERVPAVIATGIMADEARARRTLMRQYVGSDSRLPWESLFFDGHFGAPLAREQAGAYLQVLEMVRRGPSASNKQPWRIVQTGSAFQFYLQRTKGYRGGLTKLAGIEDMQRVDMGIAMCHFELAARELGLDGRWLLQEPAIEKPDQLTEYSVSWVVQA
jgi:nitroreductase